MANTHGIQQRIIEFGAQLQKQMTLYWQGQRTYANIPYLYAMLRHELVVDCRELLTQPETMQNALNWQTVANTYAQAVNIALSSALNTLSDDNNAKLADCLVIIEEQYRLTDIEIILYELRHQQLAEPPKQKQPLNDFEKQSFMMAWPDPLATLDFDALPREKLLSIATMLLQNVIHFDKNQPCMIVVMQAIKSLQPALTMHEISKLMGAITLRSAECVQYPKPLSVVTFVREHIFTLPNFDVDYDGVKRIMMHLLLLELPKFSADEKEDAALWQYVKKIPASLFYAECIKFVDVCSIQSQIAAGCALVRLSALGDKLPEHNNENLLPAWMVETLAKMLMVYAKKFPTHRASKAEIQLLNVWCSLPYKMREDNRAIESHFETKYRGWLVESEQHPYHIDDFCLILEGMTTARNLLCPILMEPEHNAFSYEKILLALVRNETLMAQLYLWSEDDANNVIWQQVKVALENTSTAHCKKLLVSAKVLDMEKNIFAKMISVSAKFKAAIESNPELTELYVSRSFNEAFCLNLLEHHWNAIKIFTTLRVLSEVSNDSLRRNLLAKAKRLLDMRTRHHYVVSSEISSCYELLRNNAKQPHLNELIDAFIHVLSMPQGVLQCLDMIEETQYNKHPDLLHAMLKHNQCFDLFVTQFCEVFRGAKALLDLMESISKIDNALLIRYSNRIKEIIVSDNDLANFCVQGAFDDKFSEYLIENDLLNPKQVCEAIKQCQNPVVMRALLVTLEKRLNILSIDMLNDLLEHTDNPQLFEMLAPKYQNKDAISKLLCLNDCPLIDSRHQLESRLLLMNKLITNPAFVTSMQTNIDTVQLVNIVRWSNDYPRSSKILRQIIFEKLLGADAETQRKQISDLLKIYNNSLELVEMICFDFSDFVLVLHFETIQSIMKARLYPNNNIISKLNTERDAELRMETELKCRILTAPKILRQYPIASWIGLLKAVRLPADSHWANELIKSILNMSPRCGNSDAINEYDVKVLLETVVGKDLDISTLGKEQQLIVKRVFFELFKIIHNGESLSPAPLFFSRPLVNTLQTKNAELAKTFLTQYITQSIASVLLSDPEFSDRHWRLLIDAMLSAKVLSAEWWAKELVRPTNRTRDRIEYVIAKDSTMLKAACDKADDVLENPAAERVKIALCATVYLRDKDSYFAEFVIDSRRLILKHIARLTVTDMPLPDQDPLSSSHLMALIDAHCRSRIKGNLRRATYPDFKLMLAENSSLDARVFEKLRPSINDEAVQNDNDVILECLYENPNLNAKYTAALIRDYLELRKFIPSEFDSIVASIRSHLQKKGLNEDEKNSKAALLIKACYRSELFNSNLGKLSNDTYEKYNQLNKSLIEHGWHVNTLGDSNEISVWSIRDNTENVVYLPKQTIRKFETIVDTLGPDFSMDDLQAADELPPALTQLLRRLGCEPILPNPRPVS